MRQNFCPDKVKALAQKYTTAFFVCLLHKVGQTLWVWWEEMENISWAHHLKKSIRDRWCVTQEPRTSELQNRNVLWLLERKTWTIFNLSWGQKVSVIPWSCSHPLCPRTGKKEQNKVLSHCRWDETDILTLNFRGSEVKQEGTHHS